MRPLGLVVYHGGCWDGLAAAWAFRSKFKDHCEYLTAQYNQKVDLRIFKDREVYILDFSYPRDVIIEISEVARSIVVLDHHASAEKELSGLDYATFDMSRSGAGIAWDFLYGNTERPFIIDYIEDRDLWNWRLPSSRDVVTAIRSYPMTFETLDRLHMLNVEDLAEAGSHINRYRDRLLNSLAKKTVITEIGGHSIPTIRCDISEFVSDIGSRLAQDSLFSIIWSEKKDGILVSFRGNGEQPLDLSNIAGIFGGGGHRNAAGCSVSNLDELIVGLELNGILKNIEEKIEI
jgi:oligoribonuclease NrnB/cAMP/cGMP phosphodiesterase (DHH superfamily)